MHLRIPSIGSSSSKIVKSPKLSTVEEAAPPPKPGDLPVERSKRQKITSDEVRELRELIRQRYYLDIELWNLRDIKYYSTNRRYIQGKMTQADAMLRKIKLKLDSWDKPEYWSSQIEYQKFKEIKARIMAEGKRNWQEHPPWEEAEARKQIEAQPRVSLGRD
jgi:hypothetical protein